LLGNTQHVNIEVRKIRIGTQHSHYSYNF